MVTLLGIVMLVRLAHPSNAKDPISVTLLGRLILVRLVQCINALTPMLVTPGGITMCAKLVQSANVSPAMRVDGGRRVPIPSAWNGQQADGPGARFTAARRVPGRPNVAPCRILS